MHNRLESEFGVSCVVPAGGVIIYRGYDHESVRIL